MLEAVLADALYHCVHLQVQWGCGHGPHVSVCAMPGTAEHQTDA